MQPQRAKLEADFASVPHPQQREAKQNFEKANQKHDGAIAAPQAADDQLASIRNRFLAAGVS
jgi:hypothetical protein